MVKCMSSRMDKYKDEIDTKDKRTTRNRDIYKEMNEDDFENLNLTSNVSIIKTENGEIDIDAIKRIVNDKYRGRAERVMEEAEEEIDVDEEVGEEPSGDTKEYDLKKIIESAHKNKTPDYERERFKKLQEMQYDILNSLKIEGEESKEQEPLNDEEATLINLIKTVTVNEKNSKNKKDNSDNLLLDLESDGNTEVLEAVTFEDEEVPDKKPTIVEELEKTKQLSRKDIEEEMNKVSLKVEDVEKAEKDDKTETEKPKKDMTKTEELSNSFYTGSYKISKKDMDDFLDLDDEMNGGSLAIKILIVVLVLVILAIGIYLLNKYLNLGLF